MGFEDLDLLLESELADSEEHATQEDKPCVMIVDDDPHVLDALEALLRDKYVLTCCSSGEEAVEKVDSSIHTVLLDIKMKGLNGFEVFEKIKEKFNHLPIVFHSAYQDAMDPYDVMNKLRPYGYVHKGQDEALLLSILERAIQFRMKFLQTDIKLAELMDTHRRLENQIKDRNSELKKRASAIKEQATKSATPNNKNALNSSMQRTSSLLKESLIQEPGESATLLGLGEVILALKKSLVETSSKGNSLSIAVMEVKDCTIIQNHHGLSSLNFLMESISSKIAATYGQEFFVGKMGNSKFSFIMPNYNRETACKKIAEIQEVLSSKPFPTAPSSQHSISITTSVGVITVKEKRPPEARSMISAAEKLLITARVNPGNTCICNVIGETG